MPCKITREFLNQHFYNPVSLQDFNKNHTKFLFNNLKKVHKDKFKKTHIKLAIDTVLNYGEEVAETNIIFENNNLEITIEEDYDNEELNEILQEVRDSYYLKLKKEVFIYLRQNHSKAFNFKVISMHDFESQHKKIIHKFIYTSLEKFIGRNEYTNPITNIIFEELQDEIYFDIATNFVTTFAKFSDDINIKNNLSYFSGKIILYKNRKYKLPMLVLKNGNPINTQFVESIIIKNHQLHLDELKLKEILKNYEESLPKFKKELIRINGIKNKLKDDIKSIEMHNKKIKTTNEKISLELHKLESIHENKNKLDSLELNKKRNLKTLFENNKNMQIIKIQLKKTTGAVEKIALKENNSKVAITDIKNKISKNNMKIKVSHKNYEEIVNALTISLKLGKKPIK
jgi:hypothetical protein